MRLDDFLEEEKPAIPFERLSTETIELSLEVRPPDPEAEEFVKAMEAALVLYPSWGPDNIRNALISDLSRFRATFVDRLPAVETERSLRPRLEELRAQHTSATG